MPTARVGQRKESAGSVAIASSRPERDLLDRNSTGGVANTRHTVDALLPRKKINVRISNWLWKSKKQRDLLYLRKADEGALKEYQLCKKKTIFCFLKLVVYTTLQDHSLNNHLKTIKACSIAAAIFLVCSAVLWIFVNYLFVFDIKLKKLLILSKTRSLANFLFVSLVELFWVL